MKIAFYSPHLSERGTETAMYDFAHYNETLLDNKSIIIYNPYSAPNNVTAVEKFNLRFDVFELGGDQCDHHWNPLMVNGPLDKILAEQKCDAVYMQKGGQNDGVVSSVCKNIILACSNHRDPHGDVYVYVSRWLSEENSNGEIPYIPIIIDIPKGKGNLREELSIPQEAVVFGRTGGMDTWSINWANECIHRALNDREDVYFVFQNTPRVFDHSRVKYVKTTADNIFKSRFISTCDAMIHCRFEGESFGQTCAEFSSMNKPVVTWLGSRERAHIDLLGDKGIYYNDPEDLYKILTGFEPLDANWNCYQDHTPEIAMKAFQDLILDKL